MLTGFQRSCLLSIKAPRSFRLGSELILLQRTSSIMSTSPKSNSENVGQEIIEGTVKMIYDTNETVFYNKVQVFNRDLSIQVIKLFAEIYTNEKRAVYEKKFSKYQEHLASGAETTRTSLKPPKAPKAGVTVLDALAASGLRSLRYLKEIPLVDTVTINDISPEANKLAKQNCIGNNIDMSRVVINLQDATELMYQHRDPLSQYDVIDLDPYGSAVSFLDSAVQSVADGGLLCVTCTDMTVLSGSYPETCFAKYHSMPVRGKYLHEMSLRILLHTIDITANKYKRYIVPWLSLSVDFYVRVFVRVFESQQEVKNSCLKRCMLYQALKTPVYHVQPLARKNEKGNYNSVRIGINFSAEDDVINGGYRMGGPFWAAPIHDQLIVDELLKRVKQYDSFSSEAEKLQYPISTVKRILGILTIISEEIKEVPFFYSLPELASTVHSSVPTYQEFKAALNNLGYSVSQFHHEPSAVKTDAPNEVIWDIMRAYCKLHPPAPGKHGLSESAKHILAQPMTHNIDFTVTSDNVRKQNKSVARFPQNPESFWGPKRRAGRKKTGEDGNSSSSEENLPESNDEPDEKRLRVEEVQR